MSNAKPINQAVDQVLAAMGSAAPVIAGDRAFHQVQAADAAIKVCQSYSEATKQKARRDCLSHLRASLCAPVAAESCTDLQRRGQV